MPSLICDVKNCSYNESNYCCLTAIKVGKHEATNNVETRCESFNQSAYTASNCAKEKQALVDIKCSASGCIYNKSELCTSECVAITGASTACCNAEDTLCGAFVCR